MKYRNGFVSNSSSSSFIITNKENFDAVKDILKNGFDYYELNGKLYTSPIHDCYDEYYKISELNEDGDCHEYLEDNYSWISVEGERGMSTVYLPKKEYLNSLRTEDGIMADEVLHIVKQFINMNDIHCVDDIYERDYLYDNLLNFIECLCGIVGYKEVKNED